MRESTSSRAWHARRARATRWPGCAATWMDPCHSRCAMCSNGRTVRPQSLLGLIDRPGGLTLLFTERSPDLKDHPGQVSFPGGRIEARDAGPEETAMREAEEEVGMERGLISVAGCLEHLLTVTGFLVTPVVAFVAAEFKPVADGCEVTEAFEVPLAFLLEATELAALDTGGIAIVDPYPRLTSIEYDDRPHLGRHRSDPCCKGLYRINFK